LRPKNPKFPFWTPERTTSLFYSYKQDTHTDIAHYIFRFMFRYTALLYANCEYELYFCEHNSHKQSTDITLYTPPVPNFVLTSAHTFLGTVILINTHLAWIHCTDVQSYCYPVCVHLYFVITGAHTLLGPVIALYVYR
jgi:hypothetical protein